MADEADITADRDESEVATTQKKQCTVRGLLASPMRGMPGAMCGHIIVSGKLCGFAGPCEHQGEPATETRSSAIAAAKGEQQ